MNTLSDNDNLVYGMHSVRAKLKTSPSTVSCLYVQQGRYDLRLQGVLGLAQSNNILIERLTRQQLDELVPNGRHQGVILKCNQMLQEYQEKDIPHLLDQLTADPLLLILDGIQDPHNLGACLRTADAAGVNLVIAPKDRSVSLTSTARKVASGAAESIPFIQVTNLVRTVTLLKDRGIWIYGTDDEATTSLYESDLTGKIALIMGAEGKGMRQLTRENCDGLIQVPMSGSVSSLNVSVATGVCLFEIIRQRGNKKA